jgi:Xaa-Pro aminopeptidase
VYLPGRGGVRIEDVIVTGDEATSGRPAHGGLLTTTTRELLAL